MSGAAGEGGEGDPAAGEAHGGVGVSCRLPLALVDGVVMRHAQQRQVGWFGWSAVGDGDEVVVFTYLGWASAGAEAAAAVADFQRRAQFGRHFGVAISRSTECSRLPASRNPAWSPAPRAATTRRSVRTSSCSTSVAVSVGVICVLRTR